MQIGRFWLRLASAALAGFLLSDAQVFALDNAREREYTIKDVMMTAYKGKLANKVIKGEATLDDKQRLLKLYEALAENSPPRGSSKSWQMKTDALVQAAQAALEGQPNAPQLLKKTMECGECHSRHK